MKSIKGHTTPAKTAAQLPKSRGPNIKSLKTSGKGRPTQKKRDW